MIKKVMLLISDDSLTEDLDEDSSGVVVDYVAMVDSNDAKLGSNAEKVNSNDEMEG